MNYSDVIARYSKFAVAGLLIAGVCIFFLESINASYFTNAAQKYRTYAPWLIAALVAPQIFNILENARELKSLIEEVLSKKDSIIHDTLFSAWQKKVKNHDQVEIYLGDSTHLTPNQTSKMQTHASTKLILGANCVAHLSAQTMSLIGRKIADHQIQIRQRTHKRLGLRLFL